VSCMSSRPFCSTLCQYLPIMFLALSRRGSGVAGAFVVWSPMPTCLHGCLSCYAALISTDMFSCL
jgi:hypothetical protein